jgi:hypothetical protein
MMQIPIDITLPIVLVLLMAVLFSLIKFRNQGTPKERTIIGLILIGLGAIMMIVGQVWNGSMIAVNYQITVFTIINLGFYNISNLHTIIGYLVLISALFCNKKKDGG